MKNFIFNAYTNILFRKGQIRNLPGKIDKFGRNVLLVYGGGSIKKRHLQNHISFIKAL